MKKTNPNQSSLMQLLNRWDLLDQFDRNRLRNSILMQNQLSREGVALYQAAQKKGII